MHTLARIRADGREIDFGIPTTADERAAVRAQRFRVYQRRGYYRRGLQADCDVHDETAAYLLATLAYGVGDRFLLGSARLILGESRETFRFLTQKAFEFVLPEAIRSMRPTQRFEVSRMVAESVQGILIGGLLIPLGLIQAISEHTRPLDVCGGLAVIKLRLLRALQGLGVLLHQIRPARLIYPQDGPVSGYYYRHPDPVVPVWWLVDEIAPSVEQPSASMIRDTGRKRSPRTYLPSPPMQRSLDPRSAMHHDWLAELSVVLADPHRVADLRADEIPALLGLLEQVRSALWAQMLRPSATLRDPDSVSSDKLLTVAEVAAEARITPGYIYEAVRRGKLAAVRKGKYVRIRRADLQAWLGDGLPATGLDPKPGGRDSRSLHGPGTPRLRERRAPLTGVARTPARASVASPSKSVDHVGLPHADPPR